MKNMHFVCLLDTSSVLLFCSFLPQLSPRSVSLYESQKGVYYFKKAEQFKLALSLLADSSIISFSLPVVLWHTIAPNFIHFLGTLAFFFSYLGWGKKGMGDREDPMREYSQERESMLSMGLNVELNPTTLESKSLVFNWLSHPGASLALFLKQGHVCRDQCCIITK